MDERRTSVIARSGSPEVDVPLQTGRADAVGESVPTLAPAPTVTAVPSREPSWPVLRRVLATVATGGEPGPGDHDAVDTLVARGLLERDGVVVRLTALGVLVMDEE